VTPATTPATVDTSPDAGAQIVLVPHTHWDREWYEPHDVFRLRLVHVLDDVLGRLEADPGFRFTLDGQAAAIQDYLEIRPEQRQRVQDLVRGGQLAVGPFLILLDEFCCDGETIVRNLELGIAAAERLGGAMAVGYLPDMFGHTAQMPQILQGFRIQHAALWRGVPASVRTHSFAWTAPDGSAVRTEYLFDSYGNALDMFAVPGQLGELSARYRQETASWYASDPVLGMLGTDHSAPAPDLMSTVRQHNDRAERAGAPRLGIATLAEYLSARPTDPSALALLPEVRGELRSHARGNLLPGVLSIRTNLKTAMADAELNLTRAERLDALYSAEDHRAFFDLAWYRVVESTAHDSITGCGVDATAEQVGARLRSAANIGRAVTERVLDTVAEAVPSDAYVLVNTLPWARVVQAEVVTGAAPAEAPGGQDLGELETALGDERMSSPELVKILRRIHGRELFGQQIVSYSWGQDRLQFEVAEVAEGVFDLAGLTAEIGSAAADDPAGEKIWRVLTTARPRRRLLIQAEVPALGHVAVRPSATPPSAPVSVTASHLVNGLVDVAVDADGTLTVTGADGTVLHGVGRLVDEGDRGDSYNFGPVAAAEPVDKPDAVYTHVLATGPLRGLIEVERRYSLPHAVDPHDRDRRLDKTEELVTRMLVELRAGEPFVRLTVDCVNTVRDHRLRLHVPLGEHVEESFAAGQFDVTRRGRSAEGGWGEFPLPTFPATGFVSAGNAHVLLAKLTEYELVSRSGGDELALTLLRAVGMMSVNVHPLRDEPAGAEIPVPGAQYLGTRVTTRLAVLPRAEGWENAEATRWAEVFRHEGLVRRGRAASGGVVPPPVSGPVLTGPAVLSSLRRVSGAAPSDRAVPAHGEEDMTDVIEARLVSTSRAEADVVFGMPDGRQWTVTDMRGESLGEDPRQPLPAGAIRTLRSPARSRRTKPGGHASGGGPR
jgi:mannosylglycerate hydrolase